MSTPLKLAGFAALLALVFGVAAVAGGAVGPDREGAAKARAQSGVGHGGDAAGADAIGGHATDGDEATANGDDAAGHRDTAGHGAADPVRGLAVSDRGVRLSLAATSLPRGRASSLRFAIRDARGAVRDFEVEHEKRMHLIVVRRDGRGFQHLHPTLDASGTWSTPITLPNAGAYRVFADFKHDERAQTLAADLVVDGSANYEPLPALATTATTQDGYEVSLDEQSVRAGREAELRFTVRRGGEVVRTEPYLGAGGHLVALREGDLAYLHVHPGDEPAGESVPFMTEFPSAGRYRLYLQFKHAGRVHTAEFTQEVAR
jgi:hypothetical protein